ncbi:MAG: hypothetical protein WD824_19050 [Cyclobacteriaceae bacterium]
MILTPDSTLEYRKNKGYKLSLVFKYNPSYLEWLIRNVDDFTIDKKKFMNLPDPTPVDAYRKGIIEDPEPQAPVGSQIKSFFLSLPGGKQEGGLRNNWNYTVQEALKLELKGIIIPSIKYSFPEEVIRLNESKQSN